MGLKKRNRVSAEFSMSSLTDIIFLLLIFFMLTSTMVKIQDFELPESDSKTVAPTSIPVTIEKNGVFKMDSEVISLAKMERMVRTKMAQETGDPENTTITIVAEVGTPFSKVVEVMSVAKKLKIKAILATQPSS